MPVRLHHLQQDQRTFTMPVGDDALTITYRPGAITPAAEAAMMEAAADRGSGAALGGMLRAALVAWDLLDDDDQPIPLTEEGMSAIPTAFLAEVVRALMEDLRPNARRGATSAGG